MSAAFALDFSGPRVACDYPRCILDAYHEGNHQFPALTPGIVVPQQAYTCFNCGTRFVIYGQTTPGERTVCDKPECLLALAHRDAEKIVVPLLCRCPQREYPHELSIHAELKQEAFNPKLRDRWPWSLMRSRRVEPSTERIQEAA
jgi:hypothetical protein